MIQIRYYVVTIVSIFLALGVGILLGGTAGQSWFAAKQQEVLQNMEEKYDKALQMNNKLQKQVNELMVQVQQNNDEVTHLMVARYSEELQGKKIYVWTSPDMKGEPLQKVFSSIGMEILPFQERSYRTDYPLLLFGKDLPFWVHTLSEKMVWKHVETIPDSPVKYWKLLEDIQNLLKETRWQHEKS